MQEEHQLSVPFDVIPLPSKGVFYQNGKDTIKVTYLTAADENILTSQNLVQQGLVVDELLRAKIVDKDITPEELHQSDREAILLFLRSTAYGSEMTFIMKDPDTGKDVEVTADLSNLSYKEFNLQKNSRGNYEYTLPVSGELVEFKFLSPSEERELEALEEQYKEMAIKPSVTKRLEKMIISIDGETDMMKLSHKIQFLRIKDSQSFRRYVGDNMPGINKEVEVTLPSGKKINTTVAFGAEFFRPFYGL
jgi:hypothetical protein